MAAGPVALSASRRSSGPLVSCRSPTPAAYAALSRILGDAFSSKLPSTLADTALCPSNFAATRRTHWLSVPSVATRSDTARGSVMRPARESFAPWTLGASSKRPKRPGSSPIQKFPSWSPIKSQIRGSVWASAASSVATRAESAPPVALVPPLHNVERGPGGEAGA